MNDRGLHYVSHFISSMKRLCTLNLSNCLVSDVGVSILSRELAKEKIVVEKLILNNNIIGKQGALNLLSYTKRVKGTQFISLKNNSIERSESTQLIKEFGSVMVTFLV